MIDTVRLKSRLLVADDYPLWIPFCESPECMKFLPFAHDETSEEAAKKWIARQLQRYQDGLHGMEWLIDKNTGEYVGQAGLLIQEIDGNTELEIGYHLLRNHWGKGYASEAAQAFKKLGFALGYKSIISIIDRTNTASQKVALQNGMTRDKEVVWRGIDVVVFRVLKS